MSISRIHAHVILVCALCPCAGAQVPDGFEVVEFGYSSVRTGRPRLNNCGQVVYPKGAFLDSPDAELFLYDNGPVAQITDDQVADGLVDINDSGTIVWTADLDGFGGGEIAMLSAEGLTYLGPGNAPTINNVGHVAWLYFVENNCHPDFDIALFDGERTILVTNDWYSDQIVQMNDLGEMVWSHGDYCQSPWVAEITVYSEGDATVMPSASSQPAAPSINNLGQVAWGSHARMELWDNGVVTTITDCGDCGRSPRLNNLGDIVYNRWYDDIESHQVWLYRVSGGQPTFHRLVDDTTNNLRGDINDWGEVVWSWRQGIGQWAGGVRYLRRIRTGEADFDGHVDLRDVAAFQNCFTAPGDFDRLCDCRFLDIDHDRDVDADDYLLFFNAITGP